MKKLYFIRHGESEANVNKLYAGTFDSPLTELGRRQAQLAGQKAKNLGIDYIISSPLSRALETARIVAKQIDYPENEIEANSLFIERSWGSLENQPWSIDDDLDGITDLESLDELISRARLALSHIEQLSAHNILIVSHGAIGRALRQHILNIAYTEASDTPDHLHLPNAEVIRWL